MFGVGVLAMPETPGFAFAGRVIQSFVGRAEDFFSVVHQVDELTNSRAYITYIPNAAATGRIL